jgi:hypothetical protein
LHNKRKFKVQEPLILLSLRDLDHHSTHNEAPFTTLNSSQKKRSNLINTDWLEIELGCEKELARVLRHKVHAGDPTKKRRILVINPPVKGKFQK